MDTQNHAMEGMVSPNFRRMTEGDSEKRVKTSSPERVSVITEAYFGAVAAIDSLESLATDLEIRLEEALSPQEEVKGEYDRDRAGVRGSKLTNSFNDIGYRVATVNERLLAIMHRLEL